LYFFFSFCLDFFFSVGIYLFLLFFFCRDLFIYLDLFFWPNQAGKMPPGRSTTEKTTKSIRKHPNQHQDQHPNQIQPLKSNQNPRGMVHAEKAPEVHMEPTAGKLGPHGFDGFQGRQEEGLGLTGVDLSMGMNMTPTWEPK
jgi:hypothetical protein